MSLPGRACRATARSCGNAQFDHLSVSDNPILALSLFVGCGRQRRYGSSVPGPFESRRRNKRKNMDMAMARARVAPDAALLFGPGTERDKPELPVIHPEPQVPLPPPFYSPTCPPPTRDPEQILYSQLTDDSSISNIRAVIADFDISLDKRPNLSEALFQHVLRTNNGGTSKEISEIHAFLKDRSLNIAGSRGCAALVERLSDRITEIKEIEEHIRFLSWAAKSEIICVDELAAIVKRIPDIKTHTGTLRGGDPDRLCSLLWLLWEGAVAGAQRGTFSLDMNGMVWLDTLLSLHPTWSSLDLVRDVFFVCYRNRLPIPQGTQYILQLLRLAASNGHIPGEITHSNDTLPLRYLEDVDSLSMNVAPNIFAHCILRVTENLTYGADDRETSGECFVLWAWILQRLHPASDLLRNGYAIQIENLSYEGERVITMDNTHRCVLKLWIVTTLGFHTAQGAFNYRRRQQAFTNLMKDLTHLLPANDDPFRRLADILQGLKFEGLPNAKPVLMTAAKMEYRRIVDEKGDISGRIDRLMGLINSGHLALDDVLRQFRPLPNSTKRRWVPHPWFIRMSRSVEITSPEFLDEMLENIESSITRRAILIGILNHHDAAKIALPFSGRAKRPVSIKDGDTLAYPPAEPDSDPSAIGCWTPDGRFIPEPNACLELFTTLSIIFAYSPGLSPRVSWGLTYWCYLYLQKHGAPIYPSVARAVHYAGVVRYREENKRVPAIVFEIVMQLVSKVEGQKAAERLMLEHKHG